MATPKINPYSRAQILSFEALLSKSKKSGKRLLAHITVQIMNQNISKSTFYYNTLFGLSILVIKVEKMYFKFKKLNTIEMNKVAATVSGNL